MIVAVFGSCTGCIEALILGLPSTEKTRFEAITRSWDDLKEEDINSEKGMGNKNAINKLPPHPRPR